VESPRRTLSPGASPAVLGKRQRISNLYADGHKALRTRFGSFILDTGTRQLVDGERECLLQVFRDFEWRRPFADLERDVDRVAAAVADRLDGRWQHREPNFQIQVLSSPFFRNKAAYLFGKIVNGLESVPFAIPILHDAICWRGRVTGPTGAGKTSMLQLLSRFYDPSAGHVRVGGVDARDVPVAELPRRGEPG